ncbi:hypothetical protein M408DRAFT_333566 [Serendipita vermifera MAFF 305830]|uniref:DUF221-domain-containing protein n=1 Tax=Serendipita vermifera MAFF 305830 TaxID=933852 RepID=A0A0C3APT6_SERVB|nr:hypothetical protein M408DRAFT_333566 [Serendipita vermifera MAFF 305830]
MDTQSDGLGRLGFGNINRNQQLRYWAHLIIAYGLTGFVIWLMRKELMLFVSLRQQFLLSRKHSRLAQARTVLITAIPHELAEEHKLRELFSFVPGGIDKIWIYRNVEQLPETFEERNQLVEKLESAATTLLTTAIKAHTQNEAKREKAEKAANKAKGKANGDAKGKSRAFPVRAFASVDDEAFANDMEKIGPQKLLASIHRPMHRINNKTGIQKYLSLPTWLGGGVKVDTIDYCTENIAKCNQTIKELREKLPEAKHFGSCFIQCELQIGAHVLAQCLSYHEPLFMSDRWIEVAPEDVVWANIDDGAYEMRTRYVLSWLATLALLILFGFPIALAGFTSNVAQSCHDYWWLAWICTTPQIVQNIIQGVFPPVLLAILFLILPYFLKGLAWFENIPRWSLISLAVYKRYFIFLVIHGFLIITFFSALAQVLRDLQNPEKIVRNFSIYVPNASTFFLTYMLQQGLMGAAGALLQVGPLIFYFVKKIFFGNTPREAYQATFLMPSFDFGVMLPRMSLLATIGLAYSIISPVINALALLAFALFWFSWKFLLIWVLDQPDAQETSGLYFPLLMSNLWNHTSIPEGVFMGLLIALTAIAQIFLKHTFEPVIAHLPMSLSTRALAQKYRRDTKQAGPANPANPVNQANQADQTNQKHEVLELFNKERLRTVVQHKLRQRNRSYHGGWDPMQHDKPKKSEAELKAEKEKSEADRAKAEEAKRKHADKANAKAAEIMSPVLAKEASGSKTSLHSEKSEKSSKKGGGSKLLGALAAAQPEGLQIDAPAKALVDSNVDSDVEDDFEEHAFDHPSTYVQQRMIWIPKWEEHAELSGELVKEIEGRGVAASDLGAWFDEYGSVKVTRGPPDEDWSGGHDN